MGKRESPTIRVAGFIVNAGRLLLVQQHRAAELHEPPYWLLPGGGLHHGESLVNCLQRELHEELGIQVVPGRPIALAESISRDPEYRKHVIHVIMAADLASSVDCDALEPKDDHVLAAAFFEARELTGLCVRPPIVERLVQWLQKPPTDIEYLGTLW